VAADPPAVVNVAYFISLYKMPGQFAWLWQALYNEQDCFVLHVDRNAADETRRAVEQIVGARDNVRFLPSIPTAWGGWSLCQTELDAIALACRLRSDWSFFFNLSAQDYPIKPLSEIRSFLARHRGTSFVTARPLAAERWHIRRRPYVLTIERNGRAIRLPLPVLSPLRPVPRFHGSGWHILAREFCDWMVRSEITEAVRRRLRHTNVPTETFMQLLLLSSPFRDRRQDDDKRFAIFEGGPNHALLTGRHFEGIRTSPALFARKFDETIDAEILHRLAGLTGSRVPDHAQDAAPVAQAAEA
jgi:Core-2/I-Branching enzyme